jgi:hypothetical protein
MEFVPLNVASLVDKANQQKELHSQTYTPAIFMFDTILNLHHIKNISKAHLFLEIVQNST